MEVVLEVVAFEQNANGKRITPTISTAGWTELDIKIDKKEKRVQLFKGSPRFLLEKTVTSKQRY